MSRPAHTLRLFDAQGTCREKRPGVADIVIIDRVADSPADRMTGILRVRGASGHDEIAMASDGICRAELRPDASLVVAQGISAPSVLGARRIALLAEIDRRRSAALDRLAQPRRAGPAARDAPRGDSPSGGLRRGGDGGAGAAAGASPRSRW